MVRDGRGRKVWTGLRLFKDVDGGRVGNGGAQQGGAGQSGEARRGAGQGRTRRLYNYAHSTYVRVHTQTYSSTSYMALRISTMR